jgi:acyl-CoA dehydrogenase
VNRTCALSYVAAGPYFEARHRDLGAHLVTQVDHAIGSEEQRLGTAAGAVAWLTHQELFEWVVPDPDGLDTPPRNESGGSGARPKPLLDVRALCVIREELSYVSATADSILAVQGLGTLPVALALHAQATVGGNHGATPWRDLLRNARRGSRIAAFALTEPRAGSDVGALETRAVAEGGDYLLDGEKTFISNVGVAHGGVVFANADPSLGKKGITAFWVDLPTFHSPQSDGTVSDGKAPTRQTAPWGVAIESQRAGGDHPLGRIVLQGVRVPIARRVGHVGDGLRLALGTLDTFRTSVGAAAIGMARRAIDETCMRLRERVQFGKPLADQPVLRAKVAHMVADLEAARLLVYRTAYAKDRGEATATDVAMAKMVATETADRIVDTAVQLHGGVGVLEGSVVERLAREVRPLRIYEGTTEIQELVLGEALLGARSQGSKGVVAKAG